MYLKWIPPPPHDIARVVMILIIFITIFYLFVKSKIH